jgi:hypothetical protein
MICPRPEAFGATPEPEDFFPEVPEAERVSLDFGRPA